MDKASMRGDERHPVARSEAGEKATAVWEGKPLVPPTPELSRRRR